MNTLSKLFLTVALFGSLSINASETPASRQALIKEYNELLRTRNRTAEQNQRISQIKAQLTAPRAPLGSKLETVRHTFPGLK